MAGMVERTFVLDPFSLSNSAPVQTVTRDDKSNTSIGIDALSPHTDAIIGRRASNYANISQTPSPIGRSEQNSSSNSFAPFGSASRVITPTASSQSHSPSLWDFGNNTTWSPPPRHISNLFGAANPLTGVLHSSSVDNGEENFYNHRREDVFELDQEFDDDVESYGPMSILQHETAKMSLDGTQELRSYDSEIGIFGMDEIQPKEPPFSPGRGGTEDSPIFPFDPFGSSPHAPSPGQQADPLFATNHGEHPLGEHPSRTLFVRNINSNVEDDELTALFEQYGAIRSMYTQCKHRGFVMISYYDIRHAKNAMRHLQGKVLRRRKLDIHYSIPKDNPSEKDQNQGTLVIFNLDPGTGNEELKQIFGAFGEIKEIRETPNKKHHKFIEFFDVRDADKAMKGLNKTEIKGKKIKIEPSRPGGTRKSTNSGLPGHFSDQMTEEEEQFWLEHQHSMSPLSPLSPSQSSAPQPPFAPTSSSSGPLAPITGTKSDGFSDSNSRSLSPLFSQYGAMSQQPLSRLSNNSSPAITSSMASPTNQLTSPSIFKMSSPLKPITKSYSTNSASPSDHLSPGRFTANFNPTPGPSSVWSNFNASNFSANPFLASSTPAYPTPVAAPPNSRPLAVSTSASQEYSEVINIRPRNSSSASSSPVPSPVFSPTSNSTPGGVETRARRGSDFDDRSRYALSIPRVLAGDDIRTTLMIKNIPNKYSQKMLLSAVDEHHKGGYDFFYLPIDFKNKCNVGYAFINFIDSSYIVPFYQEFNNKKWEKFNSEKVCEIAFARIQGKNALVSHFQNSSLMVEDKKCRPIIFHSDGPNLGEQEPFPVGPNLRRRSSGSKDDPKYRPSTPRDSVAQK